MAARRYRVRPFFRANLRGVSAGATLTWAGTSFTHTLDPTGGQDPVATDLSAAIETRAGRDLISSTLHTVRGTAQMVVESLSASGRTSGTVGLGIGWFDVDRIDTAAAGAAINPSPLDESENWLWRDPRTYRFQASQVGSFDSWQMGEMRNWFIHTKSKRRQSSLEQHLFLISHFANGAQTDFVEVSGYVNCLYGLR